MALLIISLVALLAGPLVYAIADRVRAALSAVDGFATVTISGLVLVHIIPHAMESAGLWALLVALIGFFGPGLVEHTLHRAARQAHSATLVLAIGGLILHAFFDGVGLTTPVHPEHGSVSALAIAVVLHRLPVAITVWAILRPGSGFRISSAVLVGIAGATVAGYSLGDEVGAIADAQWLGMLQALIAGSLLHVVFHRPTPAAAPRGTRTDNVFSGAGALVGLLAVALLSDTHLPHYLDRGAGFGDTFTTLALESAPALLLAFGLAGIVQVILPQASLRWMRTGKPFSESLRGVAFGLPLPICSCGVIPLYRTLVRASVPASAAMAFLVATPELGLDAILISLPLLGKQLTIVRVVCAALVAIVVGWGVGRLIPFEPALAAPEQKLAKQMGWLARARAGLRFGFGEIVDHVGPWLVLGIAIAALVEPLLRGEWIAALPWGIDVVLFALLGMPTYVCASGATPLVAVLIHKGVSPGAAVAFLLSGPATNVTTFGVLSQLHGRRIAMLFAGAIATLSIGLGLAINAMMSDFAAELTLGTDAEAEGSLLSVVCLIALAGVFALSILRQGPRGFLGQVISPYADDDECHDHDHDH